MVWKEGIAYDSRSPLIVVCGILTGQRYVDDILRPHVGLFLNDFPGVTFQQDNVRSHTTRAAWRLRTSCSDSSMVVLLPGAGLIPYRAFVGPTETPDASVTLCI